MIRFVGFIDVPGHERFVRNMLAGVASVDLALLVVAADDGPMPQTGEHLAILDLLGIPRGAVVITKIDRAEPARVEEVSAAVTALLAGTTLEGAPVFPVSALAGTGMEALRSHLVRVAQALPERPSNGGFRLAIDRSFTLAGAGLVVTGAVFAGVVRTGDTVRLTPSGREARVRGIHALDRPAEQGRAGERCALALAGPRLAKDDLGRGEWAVASHAHLATTRLDVRLRLLASEDRALAHWTPVHMHLGAGEGTGRVILLGERRVTPGAEALARIVVERPVHAMHGDRLVLRDQSARRTIGGGRVIDPLPQERAGGQAQRMAVLEAMDTTEPAASLEALLEITPRGVDLAHFALVRNLRPEEMDAVLSAAPHRSYRTRSTTRAVSMARWRAVADGLGSAVAGHHETHPDSAGPREPDLLREVRELGHRELLRAVLESLIRDGELAREGLALCRPGHTPVLPPEDEALWSAVSPHVQPGSLHPLALGDLAKHLDLPLDQVEKGLERLARRGRLVRVDRNRYLHPAALAHLARIAEQLAERSEGGRFDARAYRDASGIGRNLTIQVLEFFDVAGLTRRIGDARLLARPAAEVFGASSSGSAC